MDPDALSSMFIWIEDSDVIDAIAFCVAQSIVTMPRVRSLEHSKLQKMVDTAFYSIKHKCTLEKIYDWGKFMYSVYGWGTMAYGMATNPVVFSSSRRDNSVRLVDNGFLKYIIYFGLPNFDVNPSTHIQQRKLLYRNHTKKNCE